ncbi:acyl-CoA dehydrogenase [Actinopolyspora erythraea]|uniref:Acyl-CoA dehydrogenase n=1 Tax=Actinopolyspora erythraea TaxID=414996 RepID=A0ABR4X733_9ACTN|nr:acyl-CoA dehydrogenase [Actinopolyspora erythraea]
MLRLLAERSSDSDLRGSPDPEVLTALRESDVVGLVVPKRFGGSGSDFLKLNRTIAQLAYYDPSIAIIAFQHLAVCARIVEWGTRWQQEKLLPELASGRWLAASAWSESGAGADKKNLSTSAEEHSDGRWSVSGGKAFTTGAGLADVYLVLAQSTDVRDAESSYGSYGQSFFLVPADNPGIRPDTGLDLVGMRSSATGFVQLHECELPGDALLGPRDEAGSIIAEVKRSGATLGAVSLGIAEAAWDLVHEFARNKGLLGHQAHRHRLVELRARIEAVRGVVERAGSRVSEHPGNTTLYSKIFAAETSEEVVQALSRMLGSTGYVSGNPINRMQRDARAVALMGPTNDLSRELVSTSWTV